MSCNTDLVASARRQLNSSRISRIRQDFEAHRDVFDREVREPMAALLDSLPEEYQPFKVFRMNRDCVLR